MSGARNLQNTNIYGAGLGAAAVQIVVYLAETLSHTDIPTGIELATVTVLTALLALLLPPIRSGVDAEGMAMELRSGESTTLSGTAITTGEAGEDDQVERPTEHFQH